VILVDTSVWVDHLRSGDPLLTELLNQGRVLVHPFIVGEIALGNLRQRDLILRTLQEMPQVVQASHEEVLGFIERQNLSGRGIGYVDAHLLAAVRLTEGASLWTRDKRLHGVAEALSLAATFPS
jgi:predicted nucleic acid-binding protein